MFSEVINTHYLKTTGKYLISVFYQQMELTHIAIDIVYYVQELFYNNCITNISIGISSMLSLLWFTKFRIRFF